MQKTKGKMTMIMVMARFIPLVHDAASSSTGQMRKTLISALVDDSTTALRQIKNVDYVLYNLCLGFL